MSKEILKFIASETGLQITTLADYEKERTDHTQNTDVDGKKNLAQSTPNTDDNNKIIAGSDSITHEGNFQASSEVIDNSGVEGNVQDDSAVIQSDATEFIPMSSEEYEQAIGANPAQNTDVDGNVQDDSAAIQSDATEFVPMSSEEYEQVIDNNDEKISLPNIPNLADYINNNFDIRIVADKYLQHAHNDTYICECGSGANGHHNTGLHYYQDEQGRHRLKCFVCGRNFKVVDLILHCEKLENRGADFKKALKIACVIYGVDADNPNLDVMPETKAQSTDEKAVKPSKLLSHMDFARDNLKNFFSTKAEYRGIPYEDYQRARVGYFAKHYFKDVQGEHPALAFQTFHDSLFFRAVDGAGKDWNGGSSISALNVPTADIEKSTVFLVEGIFDALSILTATNWSAYVICTNGTSTLQKFKSVIEKIFPAEKPNFILMLDNDDKDGRNAGQDAAQNWIKELSANYIVVNRVLTDTKNVDVNKFLLSYGVEELKKRIEEIANSAQIEFKNLRNELSTRQADKGMSLTDEERKFLFSGDLSDLTNARRIAHFFKDKLRYVRDSDVWATYDNVKWTVSTDSKNSAVYPLVSKLADVLKVNAKTKKEKKIADNFHELKKVNPAINFVKSVESIFVTREDLNTHRNLLNCKNGVVDLQTKKLYPHSPELLLTQCVNAVYKPNFHSDIVNNFLFSIIPDEETRAALLRFLGYSLTGETNEDKTLFIHGEGGNGKGSLTATILKLFGNYGTAFPIKAVLSRYQSKDANAATPAFSKLLYARIAIAEEIPQGEKLDTATFKLLTGGDQIPIRLLHEEARAIENPTHKMIFSGNYLPELDDARDTGLIRRLLVIRFTQTFGTTNRDPKLKKKLIEPDALSGFLSLLVDDAAMWYQNSLLDSAAMNRDKSEYLREQDFIADFVEENCLAAANVAISFKEFKNKLCESSSTARQMTDRALSDAISKALKTIPTVEKRKTHGAIRIFGLRWKYDGTQQNFYNGFTSSEDVPY